eukprot:CAMPEP_0204455920 /NCGR_PEP_ID=MMETSP0471-20130131/1736_1 /ASSEMBLY_ACC=CAM_ASM_000602 /TAXON_ID=2969 /ORGANISM="Oxyrrhis marina" /LENGTH=85 /DNA_ID=CAMNT_0051456099 /DNA_START=20 /DNA_END=275 /DNA_ORIENTATION=-
MGRGFAAEPSREPPAASAASTGQAPDTETERRSATGWRESSGQETNAESRPPRGRSRRYRASLQAEVFVHAQLRELGEAQLRGVL